MGSHIVGPTIWSGAIDEDGFREYRLKTLIQCDSVNDGPATAMQTPGLPEEGSLWIIGNDVDIWAWCRPNMTVTPLIEGEPNDQFYVEQRFSTKFGQGRDPKNQRCAQQRIEDPLLEPQKISGSFIRKREPAVVDRFGNALFNSSWERLQGPEVEFDESTWQVRISQNVSSLELALCYSMKNTVNQFPLWGAPRRCIKLSDFHWERLYHGSCSKYYTRHFTFDIDFKTHDKLVPDIGTKALRGKWTALSGTSGGGLTWTLTSIGGVAPDPKNPFDFIRIPDYFGNPHRIPLDGKGQPFSPLLNQTVSGCITCSDQGGSPKFWKMSKGDVASGTDILTYTGGTSGCQWQGPAPDNWTLDILTSGKGDKLWTLDNADGFIYSASFEGGWDCLGPSNTLYFDADLTQADDPTLNELSPTYPGPHIILSTGSTPAVIKVEKCLESDFLLLGIPSDLES